MKHITLLLALIVILTSCRQDYDHRLIEIDAIIEEMPDSAYSALKEIDPTGLSENDLPYYALLYTQAQVKNGVIVTSDSLFHYAYDHYSHLSSGDLTKRAHFYNAEIAYQNRNYQSAMRDALTSYTMAKSANDYYWWAKSAEMISDIFHFSLNQPQSLTYELEAVENYAKSGRIANHRYALCDLAIVYLNLNEKEKGKALLDSLRNIVITEQPVDSGLYNYIGSVYISMNNGKYNPEEFIPKYLTQNYTLNSEDKINIFIAKSKYFEYKGQSDSALSSLYDARRLVENDNQFTKVILALYLNAKRTGNYQHEALYGDSLLKQYDKIVSDIVKESVMSVQRDYYSDASVLQAKRTQNYKLLFITISGFSIIVTLLIIIIYRLKLRTRNAQLENIASSILTLEEELIRREKREEVLQKQINDSQEINQKNNSIIENLFKEKWDTLNMLCKQYFEIEDSAKGRLSILNNLDKELKKLRTQKSLKEIEKAVDKYRNGIVTKLRVQCQFLSEEDITLMTLIYAGLSSRTVCLFMNFKYKLYYLRKNRIVKRIENSDVPDKDVFIAKLG